MKTSILLITFFLFFHVMVAQDSMEKKMVERAREMHRVIGVSDNEVWKGFITENYSKALVERPMTSKVETNGNGAEKSSDNPGPKNGVDEKAKMFQQLHNDFGDSKLLSIKRDGQSVEMILENKAGLKGIFKLRFENKSPYLIDGIGIEAN
jgi:hypothetical protein